MYAIIKIIKVRKSKIPGDFRFTWEMILKNSNANNVKGSYTLKPFALELERLYETRQRVMEAVKIAIKRLGLKTFKIMNIER